MSAAVCVYREPFPGKEWIKDLIRRSDASGGVAVRSLFFIPSLKSKDSGLKNEIFSCRRLVVAVDGRIGEGSGLLGDKDKTSVRNWLRGLFRERIRQGDWPVGVMIPTERELMREYAVGRPSVRAAIAGLIEEGLLYRRHGKGTHVRRQYPVDETEVLLSFSAEMSRRGYSAADLIIEGKRLEPSPELSQKLRLRAEEKVYHLKKLCHANGLPLAIEEAFLVQRLLPGLEKENLLFPLYEILFHRLRIPLARVNEEIKARLPTPQEKELLGLNSCTPVLQLERLFYTLGNVPLALISLSYRGDLYQRQQEIKPRSGEEEPRP